MVDQVTLPGGSYVLDNSDNNVKVLGPGAVVAGNGNDTIDIVDSGFVLAGNGNDSITIGEDPGPGFVIVGDGNDTITLADGGEIFQVGPSGHDTISLGAGNDTIFEQGIAQISGDFGTATLQGGSLTINQFSVFTDDVAHAGNVTMVAGSSSFLTELDGGFGASVSMLGGAGFNIFDGGHGLDTMTGGTGQNYYQFDTSTASGAGGTSVITNFVSGKDQLYLDGKDLTFLQNNSEISTSGGNTFISLGSGTTVELQGVTNLQATDITKVKLG